MPGAPGVRRGLSIERICAMLGIRSSNQTLGPVLRVAIAATAAIEYLTN